MEDIPKWLSLFFQAVFGIVVCEVLFGPLLPRLLEHLPDTFFAVVLYFIFIPGAGISLVAGIFAVLAAITSKESSISNTGSYKEPPISNEVDEG